MNDTDVYCECKTCGEIRRCTTMNNAIRLRNNLDAANKRLEIAREALRMISEDPGGGFNSVTHAVDTLLKIGD